MDDIRKHINIVAEATSSYELRVQGVVDKVLDKHAYYPLKDKEEILQAVKRYSYGVTDYMMGGRTQKEFVSDVLAGLKGKLGKPKADPAVKKAEQQRKLQKIADIVNDAIGNAVPDGDPFDDIMVKMARLGYDANRMDIMPMLDKAARLNGFRNYYDQLKVTWDEFGPPGENPWRS